jgi:hypothetical protein
LLELEGRRAWHFPQREDGDYAGYYPHDSAAAIEHLETLRAKGGEFLLLPQPAYWWLEHYSEFGQHLRSHYALVVHDADTCQIYALRGPKTSELKDAESQSNIASQQFSQQIREVIRHVLPVNATVLVFSEGDSLLMGLEGRTAWHFPQTEDGIHIGYYATESGAAIGLLESLRIKGAEYLLFPSSALGWLEQYQDFRRHLEDHYPAVIRQQHVCLVFALHEPANKRALLRALPLDWNIAGKGYA